MKRNLIVMTVATAVSALSLVVQAAELNITGRASGGGVTEIRGVAIGSARMNMVGTSRDGGRTRLFGEAAGNADVYVAGDAFGPAGEAVSDVRVESGQDSYVRVNSVNQAYHGRGVNRLRAGAVLGGRVHADQVTSVIGGYGQNTVRGKATGGETHLNSTLMTDHGIAIGALDGRSLGRQARTDLELLIDARGGRQTGVLSGESRGASHVRGLGVARQDEIFSDTRIDTLGCESRGHIEANFFSP